MVNGIAGLVLLGLLIPAAAAEKPSPSRFAVAELEPITAASGVSIPDAYVTGLKDQIVHGLKASKHFTDVVQSDDPQAARDGRLKIECAVTKFVPGNRAERYFVSFGAGATTITVHVSFVDESTQKVLLEQDVRGVVWGGVGGGKADSAEKTISKDIEGIVKKNF